MRPLNCLAALALTLLASSVLLPGVADAADPLACSRLNAGLTDEQRPVVDQWVRQQFPGGDFSIDHTCDIDGKRAIVALSDYNGLQSAVYVAEFGEGGVRSRKLIDGAVETPVLFPLPGGGRSLVHVAQRPDRGLLLRGFRATDVETGETRTLYEAHYDSRRRGCAFARTLGVPVVLVAIAARASHADGDRIADLIIDREQEDCATARTDRRELVFLARPDGWQARR